MTRTTIVAIRIVASAVLVLIPAAFAQGAPGPRAPLIPCTAATVGPCAHVASSVADLVGVWKQYLGNPMFDAPGRMGFIRFRPDGSYSLAPTAEDTDAPFGFYPRGTVTFEGEMATIHVDGDAVPPECRTATVQIHVLRHGAAPFGLSYVNIQDECDGRRADHAMPLLWIGD